MASREEELLAAILGENWTECEPHSRIEKIWQYALEVSGVEPEPAHSRIEALAIQVAELVRNGGGGGETITSLIDGSISGALTSPATSIRSQGLNGCTLITSVDFPDATRIGQYSFSNCSSLETVNFPNVSTISQYAFTNCVGLTRVDLPSITSIGQYIFRDCSNLEVLNLYSPERTSVPTLVNSNTFNGTKIADGTGYIVINDDLVDTLKGASNWATYANQIVSHTYAVQNNII